MAVDSDQRAMPPRHILGDLSRHGGERMHAALMATKGHENRAGSKAKRLSGIPFSFQLYQPFVISQAAICIAYSLKDCFNVVGPIPNVVR